MRMNDKNSFSTSGLFRLKSQDWLDRQRIAGKIAAKTLVMLKQQVLTKACDSPILLNEMAEQYILDSGGTCTFKGYKGFPAGVCISINKQLVHGIPSDVKLVDGDVISFDLGVTYEGAIADTAITVIWGEPQHDKYRILIKATEEALMRGIGAVAVGKKLDSIGYAISKYAKDQGMGVITNYGGHGLDWNTPHAPPFVSNTGSYNEGFRIQAGLAIAIEPMLVFGSARTHTLDDGWTVVTDDIGAHFEHSIYVHEDHVEIITARDGL
jgi:methionyl aminopeptidase